MYSVSLHQLIQNYLSGSKQFKAQFRFWGVLITTLYNLMLQSWYQKTAQPLVNMLLYIFCNTIGCHSNSKTPGGVLRISSDGDDRMPKAKSQDPKKSFRLPAKHQKIPGPKINPPKNPMPILWPLKFPERGNAITQRTPLEIECSCLFIHHTIWINMYPFSHRQSI